MKFKCITTCYGWRDRFWDAGQIVDIEEGEEYPTEHFVRVKRHDDDDDDVEEAPRKRRKKGDSEVSDSLSA